MVKKWLIENDKETDNKFEIIKQINENLKFCVYDIEKLAHKTISELRDNIVLSAVCYEICNDKDNEKDFPFRKLVNM